MDQSHTSQTPASGQPDPDPEELQLQVDFFRKLGYSSMEVRAALQKLGLSTDTNSMLGELVRSRAGTAASTFNPEGDETMAGHPGLDMAPSWAQGPLQDTPPPSPLDKRRDADSELKPIVIDGSNVAMSHGNQEVFSCRGIELAVNYFLDRDHTTIIVIVPSWRKEQPRSDAPITDQHILMELERKRILVFTPSRRIGRKRVVCYDDRFIVKVAYESDGVIVSNDTYRDLQGERQEWKRCIEERLLMYSFVNDKFMPPDDPLGRHGPSLDNFLRKKPLPAEQKRQLCPYDKKCTYGIKCKFYHPERTNQPYRSLADELRENAKLPAVKDKRNPMMSPMWPQSDPGPFLNSHPQSLGHELEHRLTLEHRSSPHNAQMSENMLLYWDGPHPSVNQSHGSVPIGQSQMGWPGMCSPSTSDLPYASISHEPLDSGLGSYESQYSDASQGHSKSIRSRQHQHQQHGFPSGSSRYPAMHPDRQGQGSRQPCRCCSHSSPLTDPQQHRSNPNLESHSHCQPRYDTHSHTMFPPHMQPHYSLPSSFQQGGSHHPHQQQMYWSDPFQGMPQGRTSCSLPSPVHSPHSHPHLCSSSYGDQQHSWERPQTAAFDSEREQVRKKLQAIFNPQQVDTVMGMFPHLKDAQKLAAEIINLKSQGRVF